MYDPVIDRVLNPDKVVQSPGYTQSYNRYSYCMNNPLRYNDPSGWYVADGTSWGRDIIDMSGRGVTFYDYGIGSPGNFSSGSGSNTSIGPQLIQVEGPNGSAWVNNSEYIVLYIAGIDPVSKIRPLFSKIQANYLGDNYTSAEIYRLIGGKVYLNYLSDPQKYANSCALRISYALNKSGYKIPFMKGKVGSGSDGNWYIYRVSDLAEYMTNTYGAPDVNGTIKSSFKDLQGIIQFEVNGWNDATGHFTIWDGNNVGHGDYFEQSHGIHLWILK
jgi:hypothetical protein